MKSIQQEEYIARINRVIDYIENHLDQDLSLAVLAQVACFSPYHFHRIFSSMVGESLNRFIQRIRIEKAAEQLLSNRRKSITAIALDSGFSGSDTFARMFRDRFGMSASRWREGGFREYGKNSQANRKNRQKDSNHSKAFNTVSRSNIHSTQIKLKTNLKHGDKRMFETQQMNVKVEELPERTVAYVRHIGPYAGNSSLFESLFTRIFTWAGPRGLIRFPETQVLAVYHDNPEVTDEDKLRTSICITVPVDTEVDGDIGKMKMPAGKHAMAYFELKSDQYEAAWKAVYGEWLPQSGYQPADSPCFEQYLNNPKEHPEGLCQVNICIPVKPL